MFKTGKENLLRNYSKYMKNLDYETACSLSSWSGKEIDLSGLSQGAYIVNVLDGNQINRVKLILR